MSKGTFWGNCFLKNYNFIFIFGLWAKKFPTFGENFPAGLSKLHCTSPEEHFRVFKKFSQTWTKLANIVQRERNWQTSVSKTYHLSTWFFLPFFVYGHKMIKFSIFGQRNDWVLWIIFDHLKNFRRLSCWVERKVLCILLLSYIESTEAPSNKFLSRNPKRMKNSIFYGRNYQFFTTVSRSWKTKKTRRPNTQFICTTAMSKVWEVW